MSLGKEEWVWLARELGDPGADLAILAEGNVSVRASDTTFLVKASGFSMRTIDASGFVEVSFDAILDALNGAELPTDAEVREILARSRLGDPKVMPSVETFMHAWLLQLPDVRFVAHTHPTPLLSLLSTSRAEHLAGQRLFPDEIVCCGPVTCYVPYADPGLPLAREIRDAVIRFIETHGEAPKSIWLANHGLIVLGKTAADALSGSLMGAKAARAWLGALAFGNDVRPLTAEQIQRIHRRPDEHYRQRLLWALNSGSAEG